MLFNDIVHLTLLAKVVVTIMVCAAHVQAETRAELDNRYNQWLETMYKPRVPRFTKYCKSTMQGKLTRGASQFDQDMFLFFNIFKYWPMQNRKGFYVDSGANDAMLLSNTFFFDVCLGWEGLCVEPMKMYHRDLRKVRSCRLVTNCISDKDETISFLHKTTGSRIQTVGEMRNGKSASQLRCLPLKQMLNNRTSVDLWNLDVEGHELTVLQGTNFSEVHVGTILVENSHINQCELDKLLRINRYYKYQQHIIDAVYVHSEHGDVLHQSNSPNMWFSAGFDEKYRHERLLDKRRAKITPHLFPPENLKPCPPDSTKNTTESSFGSNSNEVKQQNPNVANGNSSDQDSSASVPRRRNTRSVMRSNSDHHPFAEMDPTVGEKAVDQHHQHQHQHSLSSVATITTPTTIATTTTAAATATATTAAASTTTTTTTAATTFAGITAVRHLQVQVTETKAMKTIANATSVGKRLSAMQMDELYDAWVEEEFKPANPSYSKYCKNMLSNRRSKYAKRKAAQFDQDMFLFFNIFKYWPMQNRKGFYVDSGANDAVVLSNTFFFDVCLGWEGLCVEPLKMYHKGLRKGRSCTLVPYCLSDKKETVSFLHSTTGSRIETPADDRSSSSTRSSTRSSSSSSSSSAGSNSDTGRASSKVQCLPLKSILEQYAYDPRYRSSSNSGSSSGGSSSNNSSGGMVSSALTTTGPSSQPPPGLPNMPIIDVWNLDVEGHEIPILNGTNLQDPRLQIGTILVENSHIKQCDLDRLLNRNGFYKYQQHIIDAVYVYKGYPVINRNNEPKRQHSSRRSGRGSSVGTMWYHHGFHEEFRKERELDRLRSTTHPQFFPPENLQPCPAEPTATTASIAAIHASSIIPWIFSAMWRLLF